MSPRRRGARQAESAEQLSLSLSWLSEAEILSALRARGVGFVEEIRFRPNRARLISLSADRRRLNLHDCFRSAPGRVLDAVATFTMAPSRSRAFRDAVECMREWHEGQVAEHGLGEPLATCGTPRQMEYLAEVYQKLNTTHFGGSLPRAFLHSPTRFCVMSFTSDWLFPTSDNRQIVHALNAVAAKVSFVEIKTDKGHDAFLLDEPEMFSTLRGFIDSAARARGIGA